MTTVLAAPPVIAAVEAELRRRVEAVKNRRGKPPKLSVILVGEHPASVIYVTQKGKRCAEIGMDHETLRLPATATPQEVKATIDGLNADPNTDGILVQRPLPVAFLENEVVYWIDPKKDVDAFHPENTGRLVLGLPTFAPCTPAGVMRLLKHYQIQVAGKTACIVGRSSIVGKPMAQLLLQADATVIHCHSKTKNLEEFTRQADILVVAAGKPHLIGARHVKPGAVVIDVGVHRASADPAVRKVIGDVRYDEVMPHVSAITPVPGGVGPMTILELLENTVFSAESR